MIILKHDERNYINNNIIRNLNRGDGFRFDNNGDGFYLPGNSCQYCGKGEGFADIISTIFRFINNNRDTIKNIADVGSNVINLATATFKGVTDTIKNAEEIKHLKIIILFLKNRLLDKMGNLFHLA